jgi:hypothetical protein
MTDTADVIKALQDVLQGSSYITNDLGVATDDIMLGIRERELNYPCIILEPDINQESDLMDVYNKQDLDFTIDLHCFVKVRDKEKIVAGDDTLKGILDAENNIKKAISATPKLGLNDIIWTYIEDCEFSYQNYPIRGLTMRVRVNFRQDRLSR